MIYDKCWIDTIQWHLEDIIKPDISPKEALKSRGRLIQVIRTEQIC